MASLLFLANFSHLNPKFSDKNHKQNATAGAVALIT